MAAPVKNKVINLALFLTFLLFTSNLVFCATPNVQNKNSQISLLAKTQSKESKIVAASRALLLKIKDVSFDFKQFSDEVSATNFDVISGSVIYLSPNKFVIKQKKGILEQIFYCSGNKVFVYTPSQKQAITDKLSNWNKNSLLPLDFFSLDKFWSVLDKKFILSETKMVNENTCLVTFSTKKNSGYFIDVVIDANSYLPASIKVRNGSFEQTTQFSNFNINKGIANNKFNFIPPKDVEVVDLSN